MLTTDRVQRATVALQMAEFATNVGRRLRQLREERKAEDPRWTQDYVARQVRDDLTGAQYARWERGEVLPRKDTLEKLARVFGVGEEEFYRGSEGNGPTPDLMDSFSQSDVEVLRSEIATLKAEQKRLRSAIEKLLEPPTEYVLPPEAREGLDRQAQQLAILSEVRSVQDNLLTLLEQLARGSGVSLGKSQPSGSSKAPRQ